MEEKGLIEFLLLKDIYKIENEYCVKSDERFALHEGPFA